MMPTRQRCRKSQLHISSDSDDVPLSELMMTTLSKGGNVSDGTAGTYSHFQPRVTSTPKVFDIKIASRSRSDRLKRKRSSVFRMPSRRDVFDKIVESPKKHYSHLQPRRLINNYLKERHRYNYDHASTSGESSIDDFIDDENDEESDSDDEGSGRQIRLTALKQTKMSCIHSSSSEDDEEEETDKQQIHTATKQTRAPSRAEVSHRWTNKRRNSALESDSSGNGTSETEEATPVKKRSRGSVLSITSSDEGESETGEMTPVKKNGEHLVDSGLDSTKFEDSKTNTTGDLANMKLGSTDRVTDHASVARDTSHDMCHSTSDMDSDGSSVCVSARQKSRSCKRNSVLTDDSDTPLETSPSSLGEAVEEETMSGSCEEEGRRKTSQRVQTLAKRKRHRQSVITAYRQQRMKHLK